MRTILLALLLLFAAPVAPVLAQTAPSVDEQPLGEQPEITDARIESELGGGVQCGSGTLCAHTRGGTLALTNHHVIEGSSAIYAIVNGERHRCRLLASNRKHDVALLELPIRTAVVPISYEMPAGDKLHFRAFDCGVHFRSWWSYPSETYSVGGNSGGGVYHQGKLVAVIWGNQRHRIAFTPLSRVKGLIEKHAEAQQ